MERRMERLGKSQQCSSAPSTSDDVCHKLRIAGYLATKVEKKREKVARELRSKYSVDGSSNHFGDSHLNEVFVWRKKIERDVMEGRIEANMLSSRAERKRQIKRFAEVEKLKSRREERDIAKRKREEEMALLARERARSEIQEWEKKEEEFFLAQRKIRTEKRFRECRPKPIDILIRLLDSSSNDVDLEKDKKNVEPSMVVFEGLNVEELEKLREEIKLQLCLDRKTKMHVEYWETVLVVCEDVLDHARVCGERGIHRSIEADVERFLEGKSCNQLADIESHIESNMRSGNALEVEFWEAVLERLCVFKAKARLKSIHDKVLHDQGHIQQNKEPSEVGDGGTDRQSSSELDEKASRSYSPELIYDGDDEDEEAIDTKCFPRKPKYFNLVHTGYRWNKYNQTHYDHDNPPPKTVVGYKFNIFYPDLLDKSRAPTYLIEKDADRNDTCIIRFRAGPPYQDIAFRIVNKEWEYSRKKGFKCNFEGGILRLYFNIKSYSYRR